MPSPLSPVPLLGNLFARLPERLAEEETLELLRQSGVRIERIVSTGHTTPEGEWYDQAEDEWVAVLRGRAGLLFEGEEEPREVGPGDWLLIPAHTRHRVAWTADDEPTVWLVVFTAPDRESRP